jgi:hypothetical protein
MPRSRVALLSWLVAVPFALAVVLRLVDQWNLVATPPTFPDSASMVDRSLGSAEYRQAIWPIFLWSNLLFTLGFVMLAAFSAAVLGRLGRHLAVFAGLVAVGGALGAIAGIIPIGAADAGVWQQYCDCGFKETEIVSQIWAATVANGIGDWLLRAAAVTIAVAIVALNRDARAVLGSSLRTWGWITALALVAAPLLAVAARFGDVPDVITAIVAGILVPVWAVAVGRAVEGAEATPAGSRP